MPKKIFFTIAISFFIIPIFALSAAEPISITLNQQEFKPGDEIQAKVTFTNNYSKNLKGQLFYNFSSLSPDFPPMPQVQEIDLAPGQQSKTMDCSMTIGETMPEGIWRLEVEVRDGHNNIITKSNKQFLVTGTKKEINAELLICEDIDCKNNKAVFIKGETVYLELKTNVTDLEIDAQVQNSQTEEQQIITFTDNEIQIKIEQEGSYIINLTLSKDGYSEQSIQKNFAVINAPAQIKSVSICNQDGICASPENIQNCPQDCVKTEQAIDKTNVINIKIIIAIIAIVIIIAIMIAAYWFLVRKSSRAKIAEDNKEDNQIDNFK